MPYFTCDLADVVHLEKLQSVEILWKKDLHDTNKYFLILSKAFVLLKDKNCSSWISDLREKRTLSIDETEWLRKYMLPQAIENEVKKVAFIANKEDAISIRKKAIENVTKDKLNVRFFIDKTEAYQWISKK